MCPFLAPVFEGFFFVAAIDSDNEAKKAGGYTPLSSLYCLDVNVFTFDFDVYSTDISYDNQNMFIQATGVLSFMP